MADWYGKSLMKDEDFQEEDVWAVVREREDSSPQKVNKLTQKVKKKYSSSSSSSYAWSSIDGAGSAPRVIPKGMSYQQQQQSSAPMSIPDWSKIYSEKSNKVPCDDDGCHGHENNAVHDDGHDVDDDDDGGEMVPPHEYITRRLARTQIASFSMCEGVGRTLKGRDLSKLRNAILTKTGFLE